MSINELNLDVSNTVKELDPLFTTNSIHSTIYRLIELIKKYGKYIGIVSRDTGDILQYILNIKYLGITLPLVFEFDFIQQYINICFYNGDQTKTYLKLFLSINDDPIIKYVENDKSGTVPSYSNNTILLKPGEYLVNFSHCFFNYLGFSRVRLDDDSVLIMYDNEGAEIRIKLWLYLLLTKGKSWYAKFGYEPCNSSDYSMKINDVRNINLVSVRDHLKNILLRTNFNDLDEMLTNAIKELFTILENCNGTLEDYVKNNDIIKAGILLNKLYQSIYSKKFYIMNEDDSETMITFDWFNKFHDLFHINACQINNNISNWFVKN